MVPSIALAANTAVDERDYDDFYNNPTEGFVLAERKEEKQYKYHWGRPVFADLKWEPLRLQKVYDRGHLGDRQYRNLLAAGKDVILDHVSPRIGTQIKGDIKLEELNDAAKNDLARLVAERGVVFFTNQKSLDLDSQIDLGRYYGPLHHHPTSAMPRSALGNPDHTAVHVVYADGSKQPRDHAFNPVEQFHSDVSYELQPPSQTIFKVVTTPECGGDTIFTSGYALYDSLSPGMQAYLETLSVVHSGTEQAEGNIRSGLPVRRDPISTVHPLVRTNPVTGWKSIYVNPGFARSIVGVPRTESQAILDFLCTAFGQATNATIRYRWTPDAVAIFDNRCTLHSATYDFWPAQRHAFRVTVHGERPYLDPDSSSRQKELDKQNGVKRIRDDISTGARGYND